MKRILSVLLTALAVSVPALANEELVCLILPTCRFLQDPVPGSISTAQYLNSGILPNGSSAALVSRLAAASR